MRKLFSSILLSVLPLSIPALAQVSVSSPGNGGTVSSPFNLAASASGCANQPITAMGFSIDDSAATTVVYSAAVKTQVGSPNGTHVLHVKAWGAQGAVCVSNLTLHVTAQASASVVPPSAARAANLQNQGNWKEQHDGAVGGGWSSGSMSVVSNPSRSGHARKFVSGFSNSSAELYHISFGADPNATNFMYDAWVYLDGSSHLIANLEMDMNQTLSNGQTVIYGFQCDGYTNSWDYTRNAGSPAHAVDQWVHSGQYCNPRTWSINTWHHVQISYSRDGSGAVTYHSVWLDGKEQPINATVPSSFALGWGKTLLANFQIDGLGAGGYSTVYVDDLTISRW